MRQNRSRPRRLQQRTARRLRKADRSISAWAPSRDRGAAPGQSPTRENTQMTKVRSLLVLGAMLAAALVIAACGSDSSSSDSGGTIIRGTTDQPISYDPAGAYDLPSYDGIYSMYQNLLTVEPGGNKAVPEAARKLRLHRQEQQGLRVHAQERPEVLRRLRPDRRGRRLLVRAQHQDRRPERRLLAAREHEEHRGEGRRHRRLQPQGAGRDLAAAPHHRLRSRSSPPTSIPPTSCSRATRWSAPAATRSPTTSPASRR